MSKDLKLVLWVAGGLIVFWAIAIPAVVAGPKAWNVQP